MSEIIAEFRTMHNYSDCSRKKYLILLTVALNKFEHFYGYRTT